MTLITTVGRRTTGRKGFSMVELITALSIIGVMMAYAVPSFRKSFEQARINMCASHLNAVWTAERLYWAHNRTYAGSLTTLKDDGFLDPSFTVSITKATSPFLYSLGSESVSAFTCVADRQHTKYWSGKLQITQEGTVTGSVTGARGESISPSPN